MGADIIPLIRKGAVERAWEAYRVHASRLVDDRRLTIDRSFMEELARREREWKRLFWANEA